MLGMGNLHGALLSAMVIDNGRDRGTCCKGGGVFEVWLVDKGSEGE